MTGPRCTVIVPSYQRQALLPLVLAGLAAQTVPPEAFEVVVVLDGSRDGSAELLADWQCSGRLPNLRWHWQPNQGQAVARNTGAQLAQAPVLLFLDDDIVPAPDLVAAHLAHHQQAESLAVLGDCRVVRERDDSLYHLGVWAWWEDKYHTRALDKRQPGYRDFCTGNVSLRREDFVRVGGFNSAFRGYGGEDFELGHRLLRAGVRLVADRCAQAEHHHRTSVAGVLRATRQEGQADVLLGRLHPELRSGLRLMVVPNDRYGFLIRLALRLPAVAAALTGALQWLLPVYERFKLRRRWLHTFNTIRGYAYWRGVRDALGSWAALCAYQAGAHPLPLAALDLADGLPWPLPALWVEGPSRVALSLNGQLLGLVKLDGHLEGPLPQALTEAIVEQLGEPLAARLASAWTDA
jgi:GT2 family glycosyltransferase